MKAVFRGREKKEGGKGGGNQREGRDAETCVFFSLMTANKTKGRDFLLCMPLEKLSQPVLQEQYRSVMHHHRPEKINKLGRIALHKRLVRNYLAKFPEACCL